MNRIFVCLLLTLYLSLSIFAQNAPTLFRQPTISKTDIVFSYAGDLWTVSRNGGDAKRVTFEGTYNVSPRPSPDGKSLAFISRREGRFQLAVMDLATRQVQVVSDSNKDESPSFAPNSRMILIATEIGGRGVLSAVSSDGRIKQRLTVAAGDVREPAWGPYYQ